MAQGKAARRERKRRQRREAKERLRLRVLNRPLRR